MAGKRVASTDLNHNNWDQEDEPEERGTFRVAPENELKNRVIRKARRKAGIAADAAESKNVFSGFAGFGKTANSSTASASPFSFLSKIPVVASSVTTDVGDKTDATQTKPMFKATVSSKPNDNQEPDTTSKKMAHNSVNSEEIYLAKIKSLNKSVAEWIKTNIDKNPICVLSPIFKDYENYLKDFEKEKNIKSCATSQLPQSSTEGSSSTAAAFANFKFAPPPNTTEADSKKENNENKDGKANFKFSSTVASTNSATPAVPKFSFTSTAATVPKFSFGSGAETTSDKVSISSAISASSSTSAQSATSWTSPKNNFSFGSASTTSIFGNSSQPAGETTSPKTNGFSFSTSSGGSAGFSLTHGVKPFSFSNIQEQPANNGSDKVEEENDEEDEPPKVEIKKVVEDDAIYSQKCKVFIKKNEAFTDRGVGTLYLKPVKDSEKTQLLVRADTNLGNILVNLILSKALPTKRMGKKDVMMVCLPTPDMDKPTSMLLRVKSSEEADELLETIEKYKK